MAAMAAVEAKAAKAAGGKRGCAPIEPPVVA